MEHSNETDEETIRISDIHAISKVLSNAEMENLNVCRRKAMEIELGETALLSLEGTVDEGSKWIAPQGIFKTKEEYARAFMSTNFTEYLKRTPIRLIRKPTRDGRYMTLPFWDNDETLLYVLSTHGVTEVSNPSLYTLPIHADKVPYGNIDYGFAKAHKNEVLRTHWGRLNQKSCEYAFVGKIANCSLETIAEYEAKAYPGPRTKKQLENYVKVLKQILSKRRAGAANRGIERIPDFYSQERCIIDFKGDDAHYVYPLLKIGQVDHKL